MQAKNISEKIKSVAEFIPSQDIEKFVFKVLLLAWCAIIIVLIVLKAVLGPRDYVKRKIMEATKAVEGFPIEQADIAGYESSFGAVKYPEAVEEYTVKISRDPFSEHRIEPKLEETVRADHEFAVMSVGNIPLPLVYKGFIELPDRIIGQVSWHKATRFVNPGSVLSDYTVESITKDRLTAAYSDGRKIEFKLNTPVLTDELQAVLYDDISKKTYSVKVSDRIGQYEVTDISRDHVIIQKDGKEIMLEKK